MEYSNFQSLKAQSTRGVDYATALGMTTTSALSSVSSASDMLKEAGDTADTQLTNAIKLTGIESSAAVQKIQTHVSNLKTHQESFQTGAELAGGVELGIKAAQKVVSKGASEAVGEAPSASAELATVGAEEGTELTEIGESLGAEAAEAAGTAAAEGVGEAAAEGVAFGLGEGAAAAGFAAAESVAAASVILEPLAIAGGAVALGFSIADAIKASSREKKEQKKEKKQSKLEEQQAEAEDISSKRSAEKSFDTQKQAIEAKTNVLRTGILSNAHLSVTGGHASLRNR